MGLAILTSLLTHAYLSAQAREIAQFPQSDLPVSPSLPEELVPPPSQSPSFSDPSQLPTQPRKQPLQLPSPSSAPVVPEPTTIPSRLTVTEFQFQDHTVFTDQELKSIKLPATKTTIGAIHNQSFSFPELLQIAAEVAKYYIQGGYRTSGAVIFIPKSTRDEEKGPVIIKVIEGELEDIIVSPEERPEGGRLDGYVRSRLRVKAETPLNVDRLLEALQLLQLDPLITNIEAQLSSGSEPGKSILAVTYQPADTFTIPIILDNGRSPSVGSFQRGFAIEKENLLGLGDGIRVGYLNTDGSNRVNARYEVPVSANNSTLKLEYTYNENRVIEPPFDDVDEDGKSPDITSDYEAWDLTFRYPLIRSVDNQTFREFALGLNASWRRTQSFLFGEPFPFSLSADVLGNTKVFALRFSQDYTQQSARDILALRSQFSFGLDAFGATISEQVSGLEVIPDSRFVAWRGQFQYVRVLERDTFWLVRTNLQLSSDPLVAIEQFSLGGLGSVLGYRQDELLTDNGIFFGTEVRVPILRAFEGQGVLQVVPFVNYGVGWNSDRTSPQRNNLASVGLGLLWRSGDLSARFDWGIPLTDVDRDRRTWQENGLYFTIQYDAF